MTTQNKYLYSSDAQSTATETQWFPGDVGSVPTARHFVSSLLFGLGCSIPTRDTASIVVSELATNAILHAHSGFAVSVSRHGQIIELEVTDDSPALPIKRNVGYGAPAGRGLRVVEGLSETWGVRPHAHGKSVYALIGCIDDMVYVPVA